MAFLRASKKSAGLVLRTNEVQLLAVHGARIVAQVRVPITGTGSDALTQAIREAVVSSRLTSAQFAVAIPTADVFVRFFTIPMLPKSELDAAVQFEARKYIPFKTDALVWDYHAIEFKSGRASHLEVVFMAVQRDIFQAMQAILTDAGVEPTRIEPRSLSLARLIEPQKPRAGAPGEFACLVDVEPDQAHLVIARNGVPYLTRDIDFSKELQRPSETAAPSGAPPVAAEPAGDVKVQRVFSELRVSMDFFTREHPSAAIAHVWLLGEESLIQPWSQWLADKLWCPVGMGRELVDRTVEGRLPLAFASGVGLLQAGIRKQEVALDFLKRSLAPRSAGVSAQPKASHALSISQVKTQLLAPQSLAMFCTAGAVLLALWGAGWQQEVAEQRRLAELQQQRPALDVSLAGMGQERLEQVREALTQQLDVVKRIVEDRVGVVGKLDALPRVLSEGMWLTSFAFDERLHNTPTRSMTLKVVGSCYLPQAGGLLGAIQAFEAKVRRTAAFSNGFTDIRIQQIHEQASTINEQRYAYRSFQLQCGS